MPPRGSAAKREALRELRVLVGGGVAAAHEKNLNAYLECPPLQEGAKLLRLAIGSLDEPGNHTRLAPPPGSLPPLV